MYYNHKTRIGYYSKDTLGEQKSVSSLKRKKEKKGKA